MLVIKTGVKLVEGLTDNSNKLFGGYCRDIYMERALNGEFELGYDETNCFLCANACNVHSALENMSGILSQGTIVLRFAQSCWRALVKSVFSVNSHLASLLDMCLGMVGLSLKALLLPRRQRVPLIYSADLGFLRPIKLSAETYTLFLLRFNNPFIVSSFQT